MGQIVMMSNFPGHVPQVEAEIWNKLHNDLLQTTYQYNTTIPSGSCEVQLKIEIDRGGGFDNGYSYTILEAPVKMKQLFYFTLQNPTFLFNLGKLFGKQTVLSDYPEFDDQVRIKTNNLLRVKEIFTSESNWLAFTCLNQDFTFSLSTIHQNPVLKLRIEDGITDTTLLMPLVTAFCSVLSQLHT